MSGGDDRWTGQDDTDLKAGWPSSDLKRDTFPREPRNRSSSRGSGRVEKRIEATLPEADQPANARSRKSSHVLGLFKENTAATNIKKALDKTKTDPNAFGDRSAPRVDSTSIKRAETERFHPPLVATIFEDHVGTPHDRSVAGFDIGEDPAKTAAQHENLQRRWQSPLAGSNIFRSGESGSVQKESRDRNLASPISEGAHGDRLRSDLDVADRGTLSNLPSENTADPEVTGSAQEEPCTCCSEISGADPNIQDKDVATRHQTAGRTSLDANDRSNWIANRGETVGEDEEESDKEQISSALYYPHQLPSPDAQEEPAVSPDGDGDGLGDTETTPLEPLPPAALSIGVQSEDVDIALQSHNQSRYLHGDLQTSWGTPGGDANTRNADVGGSSVSGSEYGDEDESALSTCGEDSSHTDEPGTTPTATPMTKNSFLRLRDRKHPTPAIAPIRAVELKPYNHQVGGHSTVFRFSRRAVCKQLSNRENEFYEVVEREHPELLRFLPRYAYNHSYSHPLVMSRC